MFQHLYWNQVQPVLHVEQAVSLVHIVIRHKQILLVDNAKILTIKIVTMLVNYVPHQYLAVKSVISIVKILQLLHAHNAQQLLN